MANQISPEMMKVGYVSRDLLPDLAPFDEGAKDIRHLNFDKRVSEEAAKIMDTPAYRLKQTLHRVENETVKPFLYGVKSFFSEMKVNLGNLLAKLSPFGQTETSGQFASSQNPALRNGRSEMLFAHDKKAEASEKPKQFRENLNNMLAKGIAQSPTGKAAKRADDKPIAAPRSNANRVKTNGNVIASTQNVEAETAIDKHGRKPGPIPTPRRLG